MTRWVPITKVHKEPGLRWASIRLLRSWQYGAVGLRTSKLGGVLFVDVDDLVRRLDEGSVETGRQGGTP